MIPRVPGLALVLALTGFAVCAGVSGPARADVVRPDGTKRPAWTDEEKALPVAARKLEEDDRSSHWFVRLSESEKPHTHDADLTVFVMSGQAKVHLGERTLFAREGDVVRIPKGITHWAELAPGAVCEAYALYVKDIPAGHDAPAEQKEEVDAR
jgi:mannose-6-phosphate isomerase-like protein (cupin superfamily)